MNGLGASVWHIRMGENSEGLYTNRNIAIITLYWHENNVHRNEDWHDYD